MVGQQGTTMLHISLHVMFIYKMYIVNLTSSELTLELHNQALTPPPKKKTQKIKNPKTTIGNAGSSYHKLVLLYMCLSRHLKLLNHRRKMLPLSIICHFQASGVMDCRVSSSSQLGPTEIHLLHSKLTSFFPGGTSFRQNIKNQWRDDTVMKNTAPFLGGTQPPITPTPKDPTPSSCPCRYCIHMISYTDQQASM